MRSYLKFFKIFFWLFFFPLLSYAKELSLKEAISYALKNNLELKAFQNELKAYQLEREAVKGIYFPRIKLEEIFFQSDLPVQSFMFKLNQERFSLKDFEIQRLNHPGSYINFETILSIELPIWLGGKVQALNRQVEHRLRSAFYLYHRKEEEIIWEVYQSYLWAVLAKESIKVSESSIKEAQEHYRLAKARYEVGTALLSDVYRAEVYLAKAEESLKVAQNYYSTAKKRLQLIMNVKLDDFEVSEIQEVPQIDVNEIKKKALLKRQDLRALEEEIKALREGYRIQLSENLPQIYAFGSYHLNDKNKPFGSDGTGYLLGIKISLAFDTGLTVVKKAQAELKRALALEERYRYLKETIFYEIDKAYAEYQNALEKLKSAEERIKASQEMVRIISLRYQNGLSPMIDLLDAQTQLDLARLEKIEALKACQEAYIQILLTGGVLKENL